MMAKKGYGKQNLFTAEQRKMLGKYRNKDQKRYDELIDYYKALNSDPRRGRVLSMEGEEIHPGFEIKKENM